MSAVRVRLQRSSVCLFWQWLHVLSVYRSQFSTIILKKHSNLVLTILVHLQVDELVARCKKLNVKKEKIRAATDVARQISRLLVLSDASKSMVCIRDHEPTVNVHRMPNPMWYQEEYDGTEKMYGAFMYGVRASRNMRLSVLKRLSRLVVNQTAEKNYGGCVCIELRCRSAHIY
eukprot:SAG31_NODE_5222_length_2666_cov_1.431243_1_plen_174_part_00